MAPMEAELLLWIRARSHPALGVVFVASHYAGTAWFLSGLVLWMAGWHRIRGEAFRAWLWLGYGTGVYLGQHGLKLLLGRPRPDLWLDGRWAVSEGSYALPSGHALATAALFPLVALALSERWPRQRAWWWCLAVAAIVWVGLGRLYLGVHWPSDVVAGWLLGLAAFAFAARAFSASAPASPPRADAARAAATARSADRRAKGDRPATPEPPRPF